MQVSRLLSAVLRRQICATDMNSILLSNHMRSVENNFCLSVESTFLFRLYGSLSSSFRGACRCQESASGEFQQLVRWCGRSNSSPDLAGITIPDINQGMTPHSSSTQNVIAKHPYQHCCLYGLKLHVDELGHKEWHDKSHPAIPQKFCLHSLRPNMLDWKTWDCAASLHS